MFKCSDCGHEFDKPTYIKEDEIIDYGIGKVWATIWEGEVCPYCESCNFEEHSDEDDDATVEDEVVGVGLQQAEAVQDDGQGVASIRQA
jgi:hypothetical protein